MAHCIDCGTTLPASTQDCPACGAPKVRAHRAGREARAVSGAPLPTLESELAIAEVHLVTAGLPHDAGLTGQGAPDARRGPSETPMPRRRSWAADNDLALCASVIGAVSVAFGLLGHGWLGILAITCGHQARRQADHEGERTGRGFATIGLVLGWAAVVMTLAALVRNPPWT